MGHRLMFFFVRGYIYLGKSIDPSIELASNATILLLFFFGFFLGFISWVGSWFYHRHPHHHHRLVLFVYSIRFDSRFWNITTSSWVGLVLKRGFGVFFRGWKDGGRG